MFRTLTIGGHGAEKRCTGSPLRNCHWYISQTKPWPPRRKSEKRDIDKREKRHKRQKGDREGGGASPHVEAFAPTMLICQQRQPGRRSPGGRPTPFRLYKFNSPNGVKFPMVISWCVSEHLGIPNWESIFPMVISWCVSELLGVPNWELEFPMVISRCVSAHLGVPNWELKFTIVFSWCVSEHLGIHNWELKFPMVISCCVSEHLGVPNWELIDIPNSHFVVCFQTFTNCQEEVVIPS